MVADEVLLELIHAELVSYAYSKAESENYTDKKVLAYVITYNILLSKFHNYQ